MPSPYPRSQRPRRISLRNLFSLFIRDPGREFGPKKCVKKLVTLSHCLWHSWFKSCCWRGVGMSTPGPEVVLPHYTGQPTRYTSTTTTLYLYDRLGPHAFLGSTDTVYFDMQGLWIRINFFRIRLRPSTVPDPATTFKSSRPGWDPYYLKFEKIRNS